MGSLPSCPGHRLNDWSFLLVGFSEYNHRQSPPCRYLNNVLSTKFMVSATPLEDAVMSCTQNRRGPSSTTPRCLVRISSVIAKASQNFTNMQLRAAERFILLQSSWHPRQDSNLQNTWGQSPRPLTIRPRGYINFVLLF